jgi:hypothetical protein
MMNNYDDRPMVTVAVFESLLSIQDKKSLSFITQVQK